MSRSRITIKREDSVKIDLTPMLDVIFIMLIFFIVTASFIKEKSIDFDSLKNENTPPTIDDKPKTFLLSSAPATN